MIYDFGMNNGDDVEYYLLKGHRVVGVEANPDLCAEVRKRFAGDIRAGRLAVLNVVLAKAESAEPITFYLHNSNHVLSRLPKPPAEIISEYTPIKVSARTPASVVREFGEPLYIKIDVEHFDYEILQNLFAAGIFPPEISAESHSARVFACLVANGYNSFSLVDGSTVAVDYGHATIATAEGTQPFRFRPHSAGPFGEDIRARWEDADTFFHTLAIAGLGWKDIHASQTIPPEPSATSRTIALRQLKGLLSRAAVFAQARTLGRLRRTRS